MREASQTTPALRLLEYHMTKRMIHTTALTLSDISKYQGLVLKNAADLITEADLLYSQSHFARSFFLSIIAVEETSKVLMLIECAKKITAGESQDWSKVYAMLNSHPAKLKANLLEFRSRRLGSMPAVGGAEYKDALERVQEMNLLKQAALYIRIGEGGPLTTTQHISEDDKAKTAIELAKLSYNSADLLVREFEAKGAGCATVDLRTRYP
jgi:AbiV family abortive infection protein